MTGIARRMRPLVLAGLCLIAAPVLAETCDFYDAETGAGGNAPCQVQWAESGGATYTLGQIRFVWEETERMGQWATGRLNGRPAMRYEIDRTRYSYSTLDLQLVLDTSQ